MMDRLRRTAGPVFEKLAQNMQDVSGDNGVLKEVIRPGRGEKVPPDATVIDITLLGMEVSLLTMQRGEISRYLFSPNYAYGALGCPPLILPSATVLFEVELLDFLDTAESDTFCSLPLYVQSTFPVEKVCNVAATERQFGNYLFKRNRFHDAKDRYKRASSCLCRDVASEEENRQLDAARLLVYLNLGLTYLKLEHPSRTIIWCEKALAIDCKNVKALFRCGQACLEMREYERARNFLLRAQMLQPFSLDINNALKRLSSCYKDYMDQQKEMCFRMFAPQSSTSTQQ
ncbi:inactive peptidyl-prolyl cis-trans isomerase FKBP6 isoform X2 [Pseudophryne corroboree]|uniref:inactive peptidyl-prolyl cis-trans isomerase FKBP6 isoform X2 n=1 Tax=Pseudophryne corroboree TaxID=495146 RepID=UPI0030818194